ncbi:MAG: flagellar biosynthesis anti-sigma factor FlgM [bacterium]|nr:flagellar biosynthesis anti-sigma factor FlgM [bacterium]
MDVGPISEFTKAQEIIKKGALKEKVEERAKPEATDTDSVVVSGEAKKVQQLQDDVTLLKCIISELPTIRKDKVMEVREKLRNGFYNQQKVIEEVAERMINDSVV